MTWQTSLNSLEETEKLGEVLGHNLRGGEVVELISDLGGGKTTLAKSIAKGAGSQDNVTSPSFTISNQYKTPKFTIHHFDLYRLSDPGIIELTLSENFSDSGTVTMIEWAGSVANVLPANRIIIRIDPIANSESSRKLEITLPVTSDYLLEGLK